MASFRKRNGKWQVQVRRSGSEPQTRTFRSKEDAQVWARMIEARMDRADLPDGQKELKSLSLGDLLVRYREEITPRKKSAHKERYRLQRLLNHDIAQTRLDRLHAHKFATFRDERLTRVGPQAARHDLNLLSHAINIARTEWGVCLPSNPIDQIRKPTVPGFRERRISAEELERLSTGACVQTMPQHLWPLITVALETAMRKGEMLGLRWSDISFPERTATLAETKNGSPRVVPLSSAAIEALSSQARLGRDQVFAVSVPALRFYWDRLMKKARIEDFHFHDLRHEAISRFFEKGLSVPEVALISGHKDVRMLFRYTHLRAADLVKKL